MLHAVIMAGGSGTRFWPESRARLPKQLLALHEGQTMIQTTVQRLAGLVPPERLLIVTGAALVPEMRKQLPELPPDSFVGEPCRRDTAPCLGLAAILLSRTDPDAVLAVMPADHVITPAANFQQAIQEAASFVEREPGAIVTFGIKPSYAAESFGYLHRGEAIPAPAQTNHEKAGPEKTGPEKAGPAQPAGLYRVKQFKEKPSAKVAAQYLSSGEYYWNSGIFVWKARLILDALAAHEPEMFARLETIAKAVGTESFENVLSEEFSALRSISVDYAVMERHRAMYVLEAPFEWDDVGSWQAVSRLRGADGDGNTVDARHLGVRTRGCIIRGPRDHLIATLGLRDCIVVHTPDATLVADKRDEEAIRELVKLLQARGWEEYL